MVVALSMLSTNKHIIGGTRESDGSFNLSLIPQLMVHRKRTFIMHQDLNLT